MCTHTFFTVSVCSFRKLWLIHSSSCSQFFCPSPGGTAGLYNCVVFICFLENPHHFCPESTRLLVPSPLHQHLFPLHTLTVLTWGVTNTCSSCTHCPNVRSHQHLFPLHTLTVLMWGVTNTCSLGTRSQSSCGESPTPVPSAHAHCPNVGRGNLNTRAQNPHLQLLLMRSF